MNNSFKDGYHLNSLFWKRWKNKLPEISPELFEILVGCMLGDACIYKIGINSKIKFEQGYFHKDYLFDLFEKFKIYTFQNKPYIRCELKGQRKGLIKSYSFRTFTHPTFNKIWDIFIENKKKVIKPNLIKNFLTARSLAYWIMDDGSLQNNKKSLVIHTQSFEKNYVDIISSELNQKFDLDSKVIPHKVKYWVLFIPSKSSKKIFDLVEEYFHCSMRYKLPILDKK